MCKSDVFEKDIDYSKIVKQSTPKSTSTFIKMVRNSYATNLGMLTLYIVLQILFKINIDLRVIIKVVACHAIIYMLVLNLPISINIRSRLKKEIDSLTQPFRKSNL
jgi:hypothetical protein